MRILQWSMSPTDTFFSKIYQQDSLFVTYWWHVTTIFNKGMQIIQRKVWIPHMTFFRIDTNRITNPCLLLWSCFILSQPYWPSWPSQTSHSPFLCYSTLLGTLFLHPTWAASSLPTTNHTSNLCPHHCLPGLTSHPSSYPAATTRPSTMPTGPLNRICRTAQPFVGASTSWPACSPLDCQLVVKK